MGEDLRGLRMTPGACVHKIDLPCYPSVFGSFLRDSKEIFLLAEI
jgi:hypothetical protein